MEIKHSLIEAGGGLLGAVEGHKLGLVGPDPLPHCVEILGWWQP